MYFEVDKDENVTVEFTSSYEKKKAIELAKKKKILEFRKADTIEFRMD